MDREIIGELYRALVLLGAQADLLGTVGSWKDCLPDEDVLSGLRAWNEDHLKTLKGRIGHYEISCPRSADIHRAPLQTSGLTP